MKNISFILIFILGISSISFAQGNDCACCAEKYKEFDFWLGDWNVYDTLGNKLGENNIVQLQEGCIIQ